MIAVDILLKMNAQVEKRVRETGLTNVKTHVASAYALPLENVCLDRAFLVTVLPEIPDRRRALVELYRVLKSGGILSITEEFLDPDYPLARTIIRWVEVAGFKIIEHHANWCLYTVNFQKPAY
jgi:ubiquinone/menaquinone biosynthesis C-methylase UbiE